MILGRRWTLGASGGKEESKVPPPRRITRPNKWLLIIILVAAGLIYINRPLNKRHVVMISSTYYSESRSVRNDTVVMLFNSERRWYIDRPLLCISRNQSHEEKTLAHIQYAFAPITICSWTVFVAHCPTVKNPVSFELTSTPYFSNTVDIPLRRPYERKVDVVACFSPLFYNERWQLVVNIIEIYRQYGVGVQAFYIQSMLTEIMELLQVYQKAGYVEIEPFPMLSLGVEFENEMGYSPNTELDWRNQATAHTDCLLKYKDAAKFIIVSDIDDVLFPALGDTYLEEFMKLSAEQPHVAGFLYNRYNSEVTTTMNPHEFSLHSLIDSTVVLNEWVDGKSVMNPERVFTAWIHWPGITHEPGYKMHLVSAHRNIMVHMRKWNMNKTSSSTKKGKGKLKTSDMFELQIRDIISRQKTRLLQAEFNRTFAQTKEYKRMPTNVIYYPLVAQCYHDVFYGKAMHPDVCPGPVGCQFPPMPGVNCHIAKGNFVFHKINDGLIIHQAQRSRFVVHGDGCDMLP